MGCGDVGVLLFGFALADNQADVMYGLVDRYQSNHVQLPGETDNRGRWEVSRPSVGVPMSPANGRHWVGVKVADLGPLPPVLEDEVHPADSPKLEGLVRMPSLRAEDRKHAAEELALFVAWCKRRDVHLPEPGLFVVADYD